MFARLFCTLLVVVSLNMSTQAIDASKVWNHPVVRIGRGTLCIIGGIGLCISYECELNNGNYLHPAEKTIKVAALTLLFIEGFKSTGQGLWQIGKFAVAKVQHAIS